MKHRHLVRPVLLITLLCCSLPALAQSKRFTYDGGSAAAYARNNAWMPYGSRYDQNPFTSFQNNCTNFVSQAIMAGMLRQTNPWAVFSGRYDFVADRTASSGLKWYFINSGDRGSAWAGAKELYQYAVQNQPSWRGLHFTFVGWDYPSNRSLNPFYLRPGDVIFCDWENDGKIDHVLMVSRIDLSLYVRYPYDRIRVAGQSNNHTDTSLQYIIDKTYQDSRTWAAFRVYRPVDYNQAGK
jgi:hypothetical protein